MAIIAMKGAALEDPIPHQFVWVGDRTHQKNDQPVVRSGQSLRVGRLRHFLLYSVNTCKQPLHNRAAALFQIRVQIPDHLGKFSSHEKVKPQPRESRRFRLGDHLSKPAQGDFSIPAPWGTAHANLLGIRANGTGGFALAMCKGSRILATAVLPRQTAHDFFKAFREGAGGIVAKGLRD